MPNAPTLVIPADFKISPGQFQELALANRERRLERTPTGELIIMPPTGGNTGRRNARLVASFVNWNDRYQLGEVFDSSTAFRLPRGGDRSPDVAWVSRERWQALSAEAQESFPPLCPDFALELRSKTDSLARLQEKMAEYLDSGLSLGWLIDIQNQRVEIYRPQQVPEVLAKPKILSGELVLPYFSLDLTGLWP